MTLTASDSRAPVIQLNLDRADEAGRARASVYASVRPDRMRRHVKKNTSEHTNTRRGTDRRGPGSPQCCPSCWLTWVTQLQAAGKKKKKKR